MPKPNQDLIEYLKNAKDSYILSPQGYKDANAAELGRQGFMHVHAIALNKDIYNMPYYHWVKYSYNNPEDTHYPDQFFDIIYDLKLNLIENSTDQLIEAARLLGNKGLLIIKKPKEGDGIKEMKELARGFGGFKLKQIYKGLMIFQIHKEPLPLPKRVNVIISPFKKFEGTYIQVEVMKTRLEEQDIKVDLYKKYEQAPKKYPTIIEWEAGLNQPIPKDTNNIIEAHTFISDFSNLEVIFRKLRPGYLISIARPSTLYYYWKYYMIGGQQIGKKQKVLNWTEFNNEMQKHTLWSRTYEMAENNDIKDFTLMPHFSTKTTEQIAREVLPINTKAELHIGTCGHSAASKHYEDIAELALMLNIKCTIMGSVNELHEGSIKETSSYANRIKKKYNGANNGKIRVLIGQWTYDELTKELRKCTHLISAQDQARSVSNSMRFLISVGRPLISLTNYQALEVQALRVKSLDDITISYLNRTRTSLTNLDDGLRYGMKALAMFNHATQHTKHQSPLLPLPAYEIAVVDAPP